MGLAAGSKVMYRGFETGIVKSLTFNKDAKHSVTAHILMVPQAEFVLREKTKFWVVKPQLSVNRVENLDTLIKGSYISFAPGRGDFCDHFLVQEQPNSEEIFDPGRRFTLIAENSRSFSLGAPVLYRKLQVGEITGFDLAPDGNHVQAQIFIQEKYAHLVKDTSRFYNVSGISVKGGLAGIQVRTDSLKSVIAGGIAFYNPSGGEAVRTDHLFQLYDDYQSAESVDKSIITLRFVKADGLRKGVEVRCQGIRVGTVREVRYGPDMDSVVAEAVIDRGTERLFREDTLVWLVNPEFNLSGISNLDTMILGPYIAVTPGQGTEQQRARYCAGDRYPGLPEKEFPGVLPAGGRGPCDRGRSWSRLPPGLGLCQYPSPYEALIHEHTVFWNVSGIRMDAGLFSGVQIDAQSVEAVVAGGISLATPEGEAMGRAAGAGSHFLLHDRAEAAWSNWQPVIELKNGK